MVTGNSGSVNPDRASGIRARQCASIRLIHPFVEWIGKLLLFDLLLALAKSPVVPFSVTFAFSDFGTDVPSPKPHPSRNNQDDTDPR